MTKADGKKAKGGSPKDKKRRKLMAGMGAAAVSGALGALLHSRIGEPALDVAEDAFRSVFNPGVSENLDETERIRAMSKVYWIDFDRSADVSAGSSHPFYGAQHPKSILEAIIPFDAAQKSLFKEVIPAELLRFAESKGDVVTFGGPYSNEAIRQLMWYRRDDGNTGRFVRNEEFMHLPFAFDFLSEKDGVRRFTGGKEYIDPLCRLRLPGGGFWEPRVVDGRLASDLLVITRLPHPNGNPNQFVLSFAGCHGPGPPRPGCSCAIPQRSRR